MGVFIGPPIQGSQKMDPEQLSSYLRLLDLPPQLDTSPHPANLALIQSRHLMRIPYQSRDLHNYKNQPRPSLALDDLLSSLSICGGHCYQHSELLYAALTSLGYTVIRVGSWVLNGKELRQEMQRTHNILATDLEIPFNRLETAQTSLASQICRP